MHRSKLITLVATFSPSEWKECDRFVLIHFNSGSELDRLWKEIFKNRINLNHKHLSQSRVIEHIFPDKKVKNFLNLQSVLHQIIKDYILYNQLNKNKATRQILNVEAYFERGLVEEANKIVVKMDKTLSEGNKVSNASLLIHLSNHIAYFSKNGNKYKKDSQQYLQYSYDHLEDYFNEITTFYNLEIENRNLAGSHAFQEVQLQPGTSRSKTNTLCIIYNHCLEVRTKNNENSYEFLKNILFQTGIKTQSSNTLQIISPFLQRFAARKVNKGNIQYAEDLLQIYNEIERRKYRDKIETIDPFTLINHISLSSTLGHVKIAESLLYRYEKSIDKEHNNVCLAICNAFISFGKKNYAAVLEILSIVSSPNIVFGNIIRRIQLQSYLELYRNDIEFLNQALNNYRNFCHRHKEHMSDRAYTGSINLINILKLFANNASINKVTIAIDKDEILFSRIYLSQKLETLKRSTLN